jgi:hypothetical protein
MQVQILPTQSNGLLKPIQNQSYMFHMPSAADFLYYRIANLTKRLAEEKTPQGIRTIEIILTSLIKS